jgi:hypothetical protein
VKERPILFSGEMINALLNNRKTQTRRVIKPQHRYMQTLRSGTHEGSHDGGFDCDVINVKCPYGVAGDVLWAKETWAYYPALVGGEIYADHENERVALRYRATWTKRHSGPWRSPIFMPRWASRITLTLAADARVERVQDITEADAIAEGVSRLFSD